MPLRFTVCEPQERTHHTQDRGRALHRRRPAAESCDVETWCCGREHDVTDNTQRPTFQTTHHDVGRAPRSGHSRQSGGRDRVVSATRNTRTPATRLSRAARFLRSIAKELAEGARCPRVRSTELVLIALTCVVQRASRSRPGQGHSRAEAWVRSWGLQGTASGARPVRIADCRCSIVASPSW